MSDMRLVNLPIRDEIFDAAPVPLVVLDERHRIVALNPMFRSMLPTPDDAVGRGLLDVFPEADERRARFFEAYDRSLAGATVVLDRELYRVQVPDGAPDEFEDRWWTVRISPLDHPDGRRILLVIEDRTPEMLAEQMASTVTAELLHRTANLSSLIAVIARQSARNATEVPAYCEALVARIEALMQTTRVLSGTQWKGAPMAELVESALAPFETVLAGRVTIDGTSAAICAHGAQALTMGLHELATNAAKHGALARPGGKLRISWAPTDEGELRFLWHETGAGPTLAPEREGFGTTMLTKLLPMQLQGSADREFTADGLRYRLDIGEAMLAS